MLARQGMPVSWRSGDPGRDHAARLPGLVEAVLAEAGATLAAVDAIAACSGPGSYTGLRIALAAAKGYCYALERPLILHNRLELMLDELESMPAAAARISIALLRARAGEYFVAGRGDWMQAPTHMMEADLLAATVGWAEPANLISEEGGYPGSLTVSFFAIHEELNSYTWAQNTYEAFIAEQFADTAYATPEYLKPAYVTPSKKEK